MIMTPGVGFFYSGLLRRKNALSMIWGGVVIYAVVTFQVRTPPPFLPTLPFVAPPLCLILPSS